MSHLFTPSEKVRLNLSQREHTDAGALLRQMYYNKTALLDSLSRNECSGFPNNGGEHTLSLNMTPPRPGCVSRIGGARLPGPPRS